MMYEYRKIRDITESQLETLYAEGWEYVGQVQRKGENTPEMRFRRSEEVTKRPFTAKEIASLFPMRRAVPWRAMIGTGVGTMFAFMLVWSLVMQVEGIAGAVCLVLAVLLTALFVKRSTVKSSSWMDELIRTVPIHPDDDRGEFDARQYMQMLA